MLPRLQLVTDDAVLAEPSFVPRAEAVLAAHGRAVLLHVRGHGTAGATLYRIAERLAVAALRHGSWLLVNDRADIAMAVRAHGVQLGLRSLPLTDARLLLGRAHIGYSAHSVPEAGQAAADGADAVLLGNIYHTASHQGRVPLGPDALAAAARLARLPVIAIGGISPDRVLELARAGAHGVAVLSGVWRAPDAVSAVADYRVAMDAAWPPPNEAA